MDPISFVIDKTEELLGHSPHPAIVAIPLGAWTVSNICDGLAMASGDNSYDDAARISLGIGLVGAAGAAITGIRDYSFIKQDQPSHEVATTHGLANALATSLMAASFIIRARDHASHRPASLGARFLALAGGGISVYSAWLGGKLVQEMGEAVKPVMEQREADENVEAEASSTDRPSTGRGPQQLVRGQSR